MRLRWGRLSVCALVALVACSSGSNTGTGGAGSTSTSGTATSSATGASVPCVMTVTGDLNATYDCTADGLAGGTGIASSFVIQSTPNVKDARFVVAPSGGSLTTGTFDASNISQTLLSVASDAYTAKGTDAASATSLTITSSVDTHTKDSMGYEVYAIHGSGVSTLNKQGASGTSITLKISF